MLDFASLITAFLLGLFSSAHCVGMCGGIMGALSMAIPATAARRRWLILMSYNLGRIFSYALIGLLAGAIAAQLTSLGGAIWLRWLAGLLLILMGLYLADWWRGLVYLEKVGRHLWAFIQPLGKRFMPVDNPVKALILGMIWGWLPCGLVYSALAYAMAQGRALDAGAVMLAFGVGTLPAVLATGVAAQQLGNWLRKPKVRWPLAISIILFGLWTVWAGGHGQHSHNHADHHNDHDTHHTHDQPVHNHAEHIKTDHSEHSHQHDTEPQDDPVNHADSDHPEYKAMGDEHGDHDSHPAISNEQVESSDASSEGASLHHDHGHHHH